MSGPSNCLLRKPTTNTQFVDRACLAAILSRPLQCQTKLLWNRRKVGCLRSAEFVSPVRAVASSFFFACVLAARLPLSRQSVQGCLGGQPHKSGLDLPKWILTAFWDRTPLASLRKAWRVVGSRLQAVSKPWQPRVSRIEAVAPSIIPDSPGPESTPPKR